MFPLFEHSLKVMENTLPSVLGTFTADDSDEGQNAMLRYSILEGNQLGKKVENIL